MADSLAPGLGADLGKLLQEMLGKILPGGLSAIVGPLLTKMVGDNFPTINAMLGLPLSSNMSAAGTAMAMQQREFNQIISTTTREYDKSRELEFHQTLARNKKSFEAWSKETGNDSKEAYEKYIEAEAKGASRNPFSLGSILYKLSDPYDVQKATGYMGIMMNNMGGLAMKTGDRSMVAASHYMTKNLFKDYEAKDFGGMTLAESAGVAAALTKTKNPLSEIANLGDPKALDAGIKKFKKTVQEYAEALSPLKDIFGNDIGKMLSTLESLSGRSLASMTKEHIQNITSRINESMLVDGASMPQISAMTSTYQQAMTQMGMSDMIQAQAVNLGLETIAASSGLTPRFMNKTNFANMVSRQALSSRTSKGADTLDKAFAMWAHKNNKSIEGADLEKSKEEFQKLVTGANGEVSMSLALKAAGANSIVGLEAGIGIGGGTYYEAAKRANIGGSTAKNSNAARDTNRARRRLKSVVNRAYSDKAVDDTLEMLNNEGAVMLDMNVEQRTNYLKSKGLSDDEVKERLDVMGQIDGQKNLQSFKVRMAAKYQEQKSDREKKVLRERTERVNKVAKNLENGGVANSLKDALMEVGKNGITTEKVIEKFAAGEVFRNALENDKEMMTIGKAALASLSPEELKDEKKVKSTMLKALNFDRSAEAMTRVGYVDARNRLLAAKDPKERKRAFEDMTVASMATDESIKAYYQGTEDLKEDDETTREEKKRQREAKRKVLVDAAARGGKEAVTQAIKDNIIEEEVGKDVQVQQRYNAWLKKNDKKASAETLAEFGKDKENKDISANVTDAVNRVQDRLGDMRDAKGGAATDPLGAMNGIIDLLKPISDWCRDQTSKNSNGVIKDLWEALFGK